MSPRLAAFVSAQVAILMVAMSLDRSGARLGGFVLHGVVSAQFALIGLWIGIGDHRIGRRIAVAAVLVVGLFVMTGFRSPSAFNEWDLLIAFIRAPVLAVVYGLVRYRRHLVLNRTQDRAEVNLLRLTLGQICGVTVLIAVFLGLWRSVDTYSGPFYKGAVVLWVVLIGVGGALASVVAAALALSRRGAMSLVVASVVIPGLAAAVAWFEFSETGSWSWAIRWLTRSIIEAMVTGVSVVALRIFGYGLSNPDRRATSGRRVTTAIAPAPEAS